jgi:hypothetical protein
LYAAISLKRKAQFAVQYLAYWQELQRRDSG